MSSKLFTAVLLILLGAALPLTATITQKQQKPQTTSRTSATISALTVGGNAFGTFRPGDIATPITVTINGDQTNNVDVYIIVNGPSVNGEVGRKNVQSNSNPSVPFSWNIPGNAQPGQYNVTAAIFDPTANSGAGGEVDRKFIGVIVVGQSIDPTKPPSLGAQEPPGGSQNITFTTSATLTPADGKVNRGQNVIIRARARASAQTTAALTVIIQDPGFGQAFRRDFPPQAFTTQDSAPLEATWPVPTNASEGQYHLFIQIGSNFDPGPPIFVGQVAGGAGATPTPCPTPAGGGQPTCPSTGGAELTQGDFITSATVALAPGQVTGPIQPGKTVRINALVKSLRQAFVQVDIEVRSVTTKTIAFKNISAGEAFGVNEEKGFLPSWPIPATQEKGQYSVTIRVVKPGTGTNDTTIPHTHADAAFFNIEACTTTDRKTGRVIEIACAAPAAGGAPAPGGGGAPAPAGPPAAPVILPYGTPPGAGTAGCPPTLPPSGKGKDKKNPTPTPCPTPTPKPTDVPFVIPTDEPTPTQGPTPTKAPIPTPTPNPKNTKFVLDLILSGVGANPVASQRNVTVEVFDKKNTKVAENSGVIIHDAANGSFTGTIDIGKMLPPGPYTIKITTPRYLRKLIPGIQTITALTTYKLPQVTLIAGDVNGDNVIDIKDYNIYVACFSKKSDSPNCGNNRILADLNDDGKNDGPGNLADYRLLFSAFANQEGD